MSNYDKWDIQAANRDVYAHLRLCKQRCGEGLW
jgi:hypothetical protein